jgi:hypothetical protein
MNFNSFLLQYTTVFNILSASSHTSSLSSQERLLNVLQRSKAETRQMVLSVMTIICVMKTAPILPDRCRHILLLQETGEMNWCVVTGPNYEASSRLEFCYTRSNWIRTHYFKTRHGAVQSTWHLPLSDCSCSPTWIDTHLLCCFLSNPDRVLFLNQKP